jgi:hypothetical protein
MNMFSLNYLPPQSDIGRIEYKKTSGRELFYKIQERLCALGG